MSSKTRSQLPLSLQGYVSSVLLTAFAVHAVCLARGVRIATCHAATLPEGKSASRRNTSERRGIQSIESEAGDAGTVLNRAAVVPGTGAIES